VGVRSERVCEGAWIVVDATDGVHNDVGHRFRFLPFLQQIRSNSRGAGDWETAQLDDLVGLQPSNVNTDIGPSGLVSDRRCELMTVGRKMPKSI